MLAGCTTAKPSPSPIEMTASIKDIMSSMIDPSGDFLFASVVEMSDVNGVFLKAPRTDEEWKEVRNRAFILYEGMNLVMMEGRKVAQDGDKSKFPEVELQPEEIQKLIEGDRPAFIRRSKRLQTAAAQALKAIDAKDPKTLFDALINIDHACENCHVRYWYPKDSAVVEDARKRGILD
jgi:hypothetical protein